MSDRQQADSVRSCSDIVTHSLKYRKQDSTYINSTYEAIQHLIFASPRHFICSRYGET
jgi:hypothetical protein